MSQLTKDLYAFAGMSDAQLERVVTAATRLEDPTDQERQRMQLAQSMRRSRRLYLPCANPSCPGQATHRVKPSGAQFCETHVAPLARSGAFKVTEIKR